MTRLTNDKSIIKSFFLPATLVDSLIFAYQGTHTEAIVLNITYRREQISNLIIINHFH